MNGSQIEESVTVKGGEDGEKLIWASECARVMKFKVSLLLAGGGEKTTKCGITYFGDHYENGYQQCKISNTQSNQLHFNFRLHSALFTFFWSILNAKLTAHLS